MGITMGYMLIHTVSAFRRPPSDTLEQQRKACPLDLGDRHSIVCA
jgi:hypothetical protein